VVYIERADNLHDADLAGDATVVVLRSKELDEWAEQPVPAKADRPERETLLVAIARERPESDSNGLPSSGD
jgi:hypothetical protein